LVINFCFTVKVIEVLKGSSVVLSPDDAETRITTITWKHGEDLAAEWFGGNPTFYRIFNDGCSLNTKTGKLTISVVRPEHGGEYTPEINGRILSALKLQVLSPVPKPRITPDCNPEETKCTLTCSFDRTDDLGDVEVFWILDDRREKGTELQITKDTKEKTFICSLKNPVSSENSTELKNPLFSGESSCL
uniref:Ig-like domain-containing protein n=1 Tax=Oryzias latipes TaxID=8090 RepID=A0A3P9I3H2_ORYLA